MTSRSDRMICLFVISVMVSWLSACGGGEERFVITPTEAAFVPIVQSPDLAVGMSRLVLTLLDRDREPSFAESTEFRIRYFEPTEAGVKFDSDAALRSVMVEDMRYLVADSPPFGIAGDWAIAVTAAFEDGQSSSSPRLTIRIAAQSRGPSAGDLAPNAASPSLVDAEIRDLTRDPEPALALYRASVEHLLAESQAFVLVFATYDRCAGLPICRRAVEQAKRLLARGNIAVVHVEPFGRPQPQPLQGTIDDLVEAWRIQAEPQFYIVDAEGLVTARFEVVVEMQELEAAVELALGS